MPSLACLYAAGKNFIGQLGNKVHGRSSLGQRNMDREGLAEKQLKMAGNNLAT